MFEEVSEVVIFWLGSNHMSDSKNIGRHGTQDNETQHNDIQPNDTRHNNK
jgi:hypothetical protein